MNTRISSLILAAADVFVLIHPDTSTTQGDSAGSILSGTGILIIFGLLCIWFADYLGAFTGPVMRGGYVDSPTPVPFFAWFGWFLLCIPLAIFVFTLFTSPNAELSK
jgi:hypothetical protein